MGIVDRGQATERRARTTARTARLAVLLVAIIVVSIGCGGSAPSPTPSPAPGSPSLEPTIEVTPAPTVSPTPAPPTAAATPAGPFASTLYPYTLELAAGVRTRNWTPAVVAWDGEARFGTNTRVVDITGTTDGTLMLFGLPWDDDLASFLDLVADSASRFHGCSATDARVAFEVDGVAGLGQQELCANNTPAMSMVLLKDGYAIAVRVMVNADKVDVVFDHAVGWLDGLTWTNV